MLHKTRGIVFRYVKYKETSIITNIFTEQFGLQAYVVNGVRSKKSKNKIAFFQPLTLLDLVVYYKENTSINRISEIKCNHPFQTLPVDIKKSSIAMFITEILNKTIREHVESPALFEFLHQSFLVLDHIEEGFENFHLQFLLKLSRYLGFSAESSLEEIENIAMLDNNPESAKIIQELVISGYNQPHKLSNQQRRNIMDGILNFYRYHLDIGEIKSVQVLRELLT